MAEPEFHFPDGSRCPYSKAPTEMLRLVVFSPEQFVYGSVPGTDIDFKRRYAAILLRERSN